MAPIRRKRNVEGSEEQVTNSQEQLQLDLVSENQEGSNDFSGEENHIETSNAVENPVIEENSETIMSCFFTVIYCHT